MVKQNALEQNGPWAGQKIRVGADWILDKLKTRINNIDIDSRALGF